LRQAAEAEDFLRSPHHHHHPHLPPLLHFHFVPHRQRLQPEIHNSN